ncbi:MAG TPA: hypothetical protein VLA19_23485 [Herpetosiphonaceae bacterium]|nr:hypothetical protein [Herpetosiphonaceae bacterium]
MPSYRRLLFVVLVVLAAGSAAPARAATVPQYFPETGHSLADPMQTYWTSHGGLPVFGYPLSEAFDEQRNDAEQPFWTQYFERNRLEAHPENRAPYDVLLGRLGVEALEKQGRAWQTLPKAPPDAAHYFAPTGHAVTHAPFWAYWSGHGLEFDGRPGIAEAESLALWGYPVSEPSMETNASGDRVLTQWFERARFEDHGAKGVLLGLLGGELTAERKDEPAFRRQEAPGSTARPDLAGKLAFVRGGDTWLYRPRTGETRKLLDRTTDFRWSPDGSAIAFVLPDGLYVAAADGTGIRQVHAAADLHRPVWAPDGTALAVVRGAVRYIENSAHDEREVWVVELRSRQARRLARGANPAWAPDSQRIAYVTPITGAGPIESNVGAYTPGHNELRVARRHGQGDHVIVREVPANTPQIDTFKRSELGHALESPFWDRTGASIYVLAAVIGVPDATLYSLERADASRGGSTFVSQLSNISGAMPAPNAQAFLVGMSGLGGAPWFEAHSTTGDDAAWSWARTEGDPLELRWPGPATWAPDSQAVAYSLCEVLYGPTGRSSFCSLALLTPRGTTTLLPSIGGGLLDWGRDG